MLGTVPVAEDGSAHFRAPAGKLIYFQALDAQGLAIQSMRSATYLHAGETLTCLGCHEHKQRAGLRMTRVPAALQRPPSAIQPDVEGSNPFNYQRLVQPVLDRHCVECHREKGALPLDGEPFGLKVLPTPGHSQGSVGFFGWMESGPVVFCGDTLFRGGVGRTDLTGGSWKRLETSIREQLYTLPPETRADPGHGPETSIREEIASNPFVRG